MRTRRRFGVLRCASSAAIAVAAAASTLHAQRFVPYGGAVLLLDDAGGQLVPAHSQDSLVRAAVLGAWERQRDAACDELRSVLGKSDGFAPGVTAYQIRCDFSPSGDLLVEESVPAWGGALALELRVPGNRVRFRTTTPTPLGREFDPSLAAHFDLLIRMRLMLPSSPGPLRVDAVTGAPRNLTVHSENVATDVAFVVNDVQALLTGQDFVAMAGRMLERTSVDFTRLAEDALAPFSALLGTTSHGSLQAHLDHPGSARPGTLGGRVLPGSGVAGTRLVLVRRMWTFVATPPDYRPLIVYAIAGDGDMIWWRRESSDTQWRGPRKVRAGWPDGGRLIPAGGNAFYLLGNDGVLRWYRHLGFNTGVAAWNGPRESGSGWQRFRHVFSGSDGVLYAVDGDGALHWRRNAGFADGRAEWSASRNVGTGWQQYVKLFSTGRGVIYGVRRDGRLEWRRHEGWHDGEPRWSRPRVVGKGWDRFIAIVPVGEGVILGVTAEGRLLWHRHRDHETGVSPAQDGGPATPLGRAGNPVRAHWDGPVELGRGWLGFQMVTALLPSAPTAPR